MEAQPAAHLAEPSRRLHPNHQLNHQDTNTVEEIRGLQKELREAMATREAGAQAFIRGLTAEVATQQEAADRLPASQVRTVES